MSPYFKDLAHVHDSSNHVLTERRAFAQRQPSYLLPPSSAELIMKTPSCIVAGNPDITGIGIRVSLYIQSASIVVVSILFSKRKKIPSPLAAAWHVQLYYTIAMIIAAILQRFLNQISIFHEISSFNLAYISLMTGIAAMGTEMRFTRERGGSTLEPGTRAIYIPFTRPSYQPSLAFYIVTWFTSTAVTMWFGARILISILFFFESINPYHGCQGDSDSSEANVGNSEVWWWFLGAHVDPAKMWYLPVCIFNGVLHTQRHLSSPFGIFLYFEEDTGRVKNRAHCGRICRPRSGNRGFDTYEGA
ncbi:hypothetical protein EDD18DRAFT_1459284 [Armillaria luteobubalina]|uniref:Uncharacterized protein n=1 Tax=Armillaria luteobubalina TaxID=153913 RepID=A0AA39QFB2_9AGAR|nr:hypothetical protein EDD18DRAFT_1459284 [Armillaria luteobubalina]